MTPGQEALREAMRVEQARIYGGACREHVSEQRADEIRRRKLPDDSYYGPAPAEVIAELIDAVSPVALVRSTPIPTVRIEQAIARGHEPRQIAHELHVALADVEAVAAKMDRLSA